MSGSTAQTDARAGRAAPRPHLAEDLITVLDHVPAFVAQWGANERNLFANRAGRDWFRLDPEDMRGRHLRDVIGVTAYNEGLPVIRAVLNGEHQCFERSLVDGHGRARRAEITLTPHMVDGQVVGFFALATDITDRVNAGIALQARAEELAVARHREQTARRVNDLVTRHLYAVILDLSATLQPGRLDPTPRVELAIRHIEDAIRDLRSMLSEVSADPFERAD